MQFQVKSPAIEAERVLLSGQNLYAVAVEGKAHLVDGAVFDLFFALKAGLEALKPGPVASTVPVKRVAKTKRSSKESSSRRDAVMKWLADGPLTTAELADHVYADQSDRTKRRDACWQVLKDMRSAGQVDRVEHNGVDKWALSQSAK